MSVVGYLPQNGHELGPRNADVGKIRERLDASPEVGFRSVPYGYSLAIAYRVENRPDDENFSEVLCPVDQKT